MFRRTMLCNTAAAVFSPAELAVSNPAPKPRAKRGAKATTETSSARKTGWYEYSVSILGVSPMLQNPATDDVLDQLQFGTRAKKSADKSIPSPVIAARRLCRGPNGEFGIPADYLRACLVTAGRDVILDKRVKMSTAETSKIPAFLAIETPIMNENGDYFIAFKDQTGSDVTEADLESFQKLDAFSEATGKKVAWIVDRRKGNLKQGAGKGIAVALVRPKFMAWSFDVTIKVDHDQIDISKISELFTKAGMYSGLADFRPTCKGPFGRFKLVDIAEIGQVADDEVAAA